MSSARVGLIGSSLRGGRFFDLNPSLLSDLVRLSYDLLVKGYESFDVVASLPEIVCIRHVQQVKGLQFKRVCKADASAVLDGCRGRSSANSRFGL
jgi:hypothetical protein